MLLSDSSPKNLLPAMALDSVCFKWPRGDIKDLLPTLIKNDTEAANALINSLQDLRIASFSGATFCYSKLTNIISIADKPVISKIYVGEIETCPEDPFPELNNNLQQVNRLFKEAGWFGAFNTHTDCRYLVLSYDEMGELLINN